MIKEKEIPFLLGTPIIQTEKWENKQLKVVQLKKRNVPKETPILFMDYKKAARLD